MNVVSVRPRLQATTFMILCAILEHTVVEKYAGVNIKAALLGTTCAPTLNSMLPV